jgi:hypothetical protein
MPAVPPDLPLLGDAFPDDAALELGARTGLAPGQVMGIGQGAEREYVVVDHVEGPPDPALAGRVLLRTPLAFPHPRTGPAAQRTVPGAPGIMRLLTDGVLPGERVAFVDDASLLISGGVLHVEDGDPLRAEYLVAVLPEAATDVAGFYRLGPVSRAMALRVRFTPPVGPAVESTWVVRYDLPENVVNGRI